MTNPPNYKVWARRNSKVSNFCYKKGKTIQKGFGPIVTELKLCCCQLNIEETLIASLLCESLFEFSHDFSH